MSEQNKTQVLIIGAGPTGLTVAIELRRRGISCRIVDKVIPRPYSESRAEGIHAKSLEIFERNGLLPRILEGGKILHGFSFFADGKSIGEISFRGLDTPHNYAVLLPQSEVERIMLEHLADLGLTVERPVEVVQLNQTDEAVWATLRYQDGREQTVQADYLIAADGGHSVVRKQLGLDFDGHQLQGAYVMDVEATFKLNLPGDAGNFILGPHGFLVLGLRPDGLWRLALSLPSSDQRMTRQTPDLEQMQAILDQDFPALGARLSRTNWASAFFLSSRIVRDLRKKRIFLAGDAAHIHSPVGGQGMNTGIQDAVNLTWKLALRLKGFGDERLLDSYATERYPIMKRLIATTNASTNAILVTNPVLIRLRNFLLTRLTRFKTFQTALVSSFTGFEVRYRHSPISAQAHSITRLKGLSLGEIGPDAPGLVGLDGQARRWYEIWGQDPRHQLLIFTGEVSVERRNQAKRVANEIKAHYSSLVHPYLITRSAPIVSSLEDGLLDLEDGLLDVDGKLHQRYKSSSKGGLYLIRPDGYIAFAGRIEDAAQLYEYLSQFFMRSCAAKSLQPV